MFYNVGVLFGTRRAACSALLFVASLFFNPVSTFAVGSVNLVWNPSSDPNVVGYKIYYGGASHTYTNVVDVGSATNVTINGLVDGVTYYFAATAYNILGIESDYSSEVSYAVPGNQPPTLDTISSLSIAEDTALQTINLAGISSGAAD